MSSEQGPHAWGCKRPRVLPGLRNAERKNHCRDNEEAA
jgi:hypothetical protein